MLSNNVRSLLSVDSQNKIHIREVSGLKKGGFRVTHRIAALYLFAKVAKPHYNVDKSRIVYLRLTTDIQTAKDQVQELIDTLEINRPIAEDNTTHRRVGRGYELHLQHCKAYLNVTHAKEYRKAIQEEAAWEAKQKLKAMAAVQ